MLNSLDLDMSFDRILGGEPSAVRDPYPIYNRMRAQGDVYLYKGSMPIAMSHAAVRQVSVDDSRFLTHRGIDRFRLDNLDEADKARVAEICAFEQLQLSGMNGDVHKRARNAVQRGFGASRIADMTEYVSSLMDEISDSMVAQGDVVDLLQLAYQVPLLVIMRLLGAPVKDMDMLRGWSDDIARVKQFVGADLSSETIRATHDGILNLKAYINEMARDHKSHPDRTHLMGLLLDAEEGNKLSADELSATFVVLFYAGHETTTNLIMNGIFEMLRNREQWERLCAQPELAADAVEEVLRYNPPVQMMVRRASEDVELFGQEITAGSNVMMLYGAANRDPAVFEKPDRFDIGRKQSKHYGFGHGPHVCIGQQFARMEGRIAFDYLARRFPDMELASDPDQLEWHPHAVFHGLKALPVRLGNDRGKVQS